MEQMEIHNAKQKKRNLEVMKVSKRHLVETRNRFSSQKNNVEQWFSSLNIFKGLDVYEMIFSKQKSKQMNMQHPLLLHERKVHTKRVHEEHLETDIQHNTNKDFSSITDCPAIGIL